jgi:hypothetical protein
VGHLSEQVVACACQDAVDSRPRKTVRRGLCRFGRFDAVIRTIERDRRHANGWLVSQWALNLGIGRVALHQAVAVSVGVKHHFHKIRVGKRWYGKCKLGLSERLGLRPLLPQELRHVFAVRL